MGEGEVCFPIFTLFPSAGANDREYFKLGKPPPSTRNINRSPILQLPGDFDLLKTGFGSSYLGSDK